MPTEYRPVNAPPAGGGCLMIGAALAALLFGGLSYVTGKDEGRIDPVYATVAVAAVVVFAWSLWKSRKAP